jgi:hypothetical protein
MINDDKAKYPMLSHALAPYAFGTVVVAIFYRMSGLLLGRSCEMGEIVLVE